MNGKTHLVFGLFLALLFLPYVEHKVVFVPIVLLMSLGPDVDHSYSYLGQKKYFRVLQWFVKHRGLIHSLTFCIFLTGLFALFFPIVALPFFLGYAGHLFADSLTIEGVKPFWPLSYKARGSIRTGGVRERGIYLVLIALSVFLLVLNFV